MNVYLIGFVIWAASTVGSFFYGVSFGEDAERAKQAAVEVAIAQTRQAAEEGAARAIAKNKAVRTIIKNKVETLVRDNPVYRDCEHTPAGLQVINEALGGRAGGTGDRQLP